MLVLGKRRNNFLSPSQPLAVPKDLDVNKSCRHRTSSKLRNSVLALSYVTASPYLSLTPRPQVGILARSTVRFETEFVIQEVRHWWRRHRAHTCSTAVPERGKASSIDMKFKKQRASAPVETCEHSDSGPTNSNLASWPLFWH